MEGNKSEKKHNWWKSDMKVIKMKKTIFMKRKLISTSNWRKSTSHSEINININDSTSTLLFTTEECSIALFFTVYLFISLTWASCLISLTSLVNSAMSLSRWVQNLSTFVSRSARALSMALRTLVIAGFRVWEHNKYFPTRSDFIFCCEKSPLWQPCFQLSYYSFLCE